MLDTLLNWWTRKSKAAKAGLFFVGIIAYAAIHGALVNMGVLEKPEPAPTPVEAVAETKPEAPKAPAPEMIVRPHLRATLHDWDSYESEGYSEPQRTTHKGQEVYMVVHKFRAKNGFGAMRLTTQVYYYTQEGTIVDVATVE